MRVSGEPPIELFTLFHAFSTALHREESLPGLLQTLVMRGVQLVTHAAAGSFLRYEAVSNRLQFERSYGYAFPDQLAAIGFEAHSSPLMEVLEKGNPKVFQHESSVAWLPDEWQEIYLQGNHQRVSVESIAVAVYDRQHVIGVLIVECFGGSRFQPADAEIISSYARQATLAIHKVQLYQENLRITQALDEELQSVGDVQRELLPASVPDVAHWDWFTFYQPATRAGGDYYDFVALGDGRWAVLIADVTGHGAPAAVIAAMIKVILHQLLESEVYPERMLEEANRRIRKYIHSQYFVTLFLGILDPASNRLVYVSAGHVPPMCRRHQSCAIEELKNERGFPLRLTEENTFDVRQVSLYPGDVLVFVTDGITELFNEEQQVFTFTRLEEVILSVDDCSAQSVGEGILAALAAFRGNADIYDDLTLIVLRILEG